MYTKVRDSAGTDEIDEFYCTSYSTLSQCVMLSIRQDIFISTCEVIPHIAEKFCDKLMNCLLAKMEA